VLLSIVVHSQDAVGLIHAFGGKAFNLFPAAMVVEGDVIERFSETVVDFKFLPVPGQMGGETQLVHFEIRAKERFGN
jgi:hypothetical protein